ncbi:uncharacterized protein LOC131877444 [Tigriopus californicus]|uniref:uncharacterized protein LOC131877444 n=1 Tax=Tigriopus californicus TaxID=6832 RepID=UPI0027DA1F5E|nr:uncharacterized protein LOC131877444 [Tigriopus californicus]|eukprot:TCALIF_09178-PA protein Name:"Protein of unknown function" AED:0.20 eAED:0.20 QI:121/0.75/0.6/1/1/1/5/135/246
MKSTIRFVSCGIVLVLIVLVTSSPVPQETPANDNDYVDAVVVKATNDGDEEVAVTTNDDDDSVKKPIEALGGLMKGLFDLIRGSLTVIQGAAKNIQKVSEDPEVAKTVDGLLKTGAAVAGGALKAGQQAFENAPEVIERSSQFVGGVVKTANETQPVLKKNFEQLQRFGKIAGAALSGISSVVIDNVQGFFGTFNRRLQCNMECSEKNLSSPSEIEECQARLCDGFNAKEFKFDESKEKDSDTDKV